MTDKKSSPRWTPEQLEAITTGGCNLLVAAAAGAGKTAVLVERIIKKITDEKNPIDIDRLLVVTFTNAAATEMRERIGDAIGKALDQHPNSKQLQRQLTLLHKASITTIHSFCLEVIRNHFHCIDLDAGFKIADETESLLMKIEALEELFEEKYEEENVSEIFLQLVECYGGNRDDQKLQDMVFTLHDFVQSCPWPEKWLHEKTEAFNIPDDADFGSTLWAKVLIQSMQIELTGLLSGIERARNIIGTDEGLMPYLSAFQEDEGNIRLLLKRCDGPWDDLYDALSGFEFKRFARCGKEADKEKQEKVKIIRDEVKKKIKKFKNEIFMSISRGIIEDLKTLYPMMQYLAQLVLEFDDRYTMKKKEKSLVDFNDLEHYCLEILTEIKDEGTADHDPVPSKIAYEYRVKFEEIFVDEYQDSNLVQEVILGMISRQDEESPNLFMVGDVKQSIYRFRQARPDLFLDKYNTYETLADASNRKIQLYKNFRSRKEIVDGVNFIFRQIMSENIGELDYNEEEMLNLGARYEILEDAGVFIGGETEIHLVDLGDTQREMSGREDEQAGEDGSDEDGLTADEIQEEEPDAAQCEARIIAKRIKELMRPDKDGKLFKVYDKKNGTYRQAAYRDIVILLRATRHWAEQFAGELGDHGIPVYADVGTGYFKTIEVQIVMSLLQVIDNPRQDIPLLSVLRSPIVSLSPEELIDIRLTNREGSFYEAMQKLAAEEGKGAAKKTRRFLVQLDRWRKKALHMSTDELLWYLYHDTGYYSYAGAMPGGLQRQANLRILFDRARQYEETSYKGLFNFINFINRLKSSQGDMGSAKILGENDNVVKIMSIHKSKGLEFPITFIAGAGKQFNLMDMNRNILLHQDLGFGPDLVDHERRIVYPTVPKQALKAKIKLESLSEEMRVLYVAFTRAKEKLIITGSVKNMDKAVAQWCGSLEAKNIKLPEYEILKGNSYLSWIGPALIRHRDCGKFRALAKVREEAIDSLVQDDSCWDIHLWNKRELLTSKAKPEEDEQYFLSGFEGAKDGQPFSRYYQDIRERLEWTYQYNMASKLPTKMSVTELKRRFNTELAEEYAMPIFVPPLVKKPVFLEESKGFTAAERGTIFHSVMQHLRLDRISTSAVVEEQIYGMVADELLTEQQAKVVDIEKIVRFFHSPLGRRMLQATNIYREIPFNIELHCREIYKDLPEEGYAQETVLVQGVIDCYFEEGEDIVLIDYKTDYVSNGNTDIIKEKYRIQIDYYAKALESITGKRVTEKYIYLFRNGETIGY